MSLINKMLQDLDKRHAADGGGKTLTQQLRPVRAPARKDWQRIMWEVGAGLVVGAGWAAWVLYQISPRSVVTDLVFQVQSKRAQGAAGVQAPAAPAAPMATQATAPQVPPAAPVPAQAAAAQLPPVAATTAPAPSASKGTEPINVDMLKLATEIATPFDEKRYAAKPKAERRLAAESAPPRRTANRGKGVQEAITEGAPTPAAHAHAQTSIDKQVHVPTQAERAENEFRKATGLLNQGRVAEAIDDYKSALHQDATHAPARQALVGLLLENRRIDEAQQVLREGLNLNPDRTSYAILLARIQVDRGDLQGAHDLLSKHAASAAGDAEYYAFDAAVLQRLGRHQEAVAGYQQALKLAPRAGLWWMGMGISLQAEKRSAEALEAFQRAKSVGGLSPALLAFVDQRMKQLQ